MPHKRKSSVCLNCSHTLQPEDNFCPRCGQENDNRAVSFMALTSDYIEETIGLDSKFIRSLPPFFLQPGKLPLSFSLGQRKRYLPPVRFYLLLGVFFFLTLNYTLNTRITEDLGTPEQHAARRAKTARRVDSLRNLYASIDSTLLARRTMQSMDTTGLFKLKKDSAKIHRRLNAIDTITLNLGPLLSAHVANSDLQNDSLTDSVIASRNRIGNDLIGRRIVSQMRRMAKEEEMAGGALTRFFTENASMAGFVMVPLFAFFMRLIYWRKGWHYVSHLVFVLYFQAFTFATAGLGFIITHFLRDDKNNFFFNYTPIGVILWCMVYGYLSLKRMYGENYLWTSIKFILAFGAWSVTFGIVIAILAFASLLFF